MHARGHPHGDSRYSWSQIDFGIYFLLKVSKIWDLGSAPLASYRCPPGVTRPRVILFKILSSPTIWATFRGHVLGPWARSGNYWPTEA